MAINELSREMNSETFLSFYYLKKELVDFCRKNGLPTSGRKIELTERIAHFLDTGEIIAKKVPPRKKVNIGDITLDTLIEQDFVCSETCKTGKTKRMIYNEVNEYIISNEERLRKRHIMKITDDNWWIWGRDFYKSNSSRIYVNAKTRNKNPFFINNCKNYDGSVLAIFPKVEMNIEEVCDMLNSVDWNELGFMCDGRYLFSQRSLENCKLPHIFNKYIKKEISIW